jgi:outer membrane protein OmpA-like peptidoglycan-associated protein
VKEGTKPNADASDQKPGSAARPSSSGSGPATSAAGAGDAGNAGNEAIYSKFDFVPGDRVIFFDDFRETDVGEFPRKWTLNGPKSGNNNAVEVVEYQGARFLRSAPAGTDGTQHSSTQYIRLSQKGDLPEKFTLEFDAVLSNRGDYSALYYVYLLSDLEGVPGQHIEPGMLLFSGLGGRSANTRADVSKSDNKVHHIAVSVNGTFVKAYIDEQRVANDPDGIIRPIRLVGISMWSEGNVPTDRVMLTNVRLAAGGKEVKSALDTDGKIVTHGILFDTGKAVIKPESLPTLRTILALLEGSPSLKFSIEGHTDNQGGNAVNQPLSENRAAAVREWLVSKKVAPERLRTKGLGDSKPMDSNSTPEGRANNRRVEFVKF